MGGCGQQPDLIRINGETRDSIPAWDRGLAYGDGLFETMRVIRGCIPLWPRHRLRLQEGAERLHLRLPADTFAALEQDIQCLGRELDQGICKLIVTRGNAGPGYAADPDVASNVQLQGYRRAEWPEARGLQVRTCKVRLAAQPRLAGIKHLNRLEQVLARAEWQDPTIEEGLMFDQSGRLVEAISGNLFFERDGALYTPSLQDCGVAGVFRGWLMDRLHQAGLRVGIADITAEEFGQLEGMLVCNAVQGARPVQSIDGQTLRCGPATLTAVALSAEAFAPDPEQP